MKTNALHAAALGLAMWVAVGSASAAGFSASRIDTIKNSANLVVSHFLAAPNLQTGLAAANFSVSACYENYLPNAPGTYHPSFMEAGLKCMAGDLSDWTLHKWLQERIKGLQPDAMYDANDEEALALIGRRMQDANDKYGTWPTDVPLQTFMHTVTECVDGQQYCVRTVCVIWDTEWSSGPIEPSAR